MDVQKIIYEDMGWILLACNNTKWREQEWPLFKKKPENSRVCILKVYQ